MATITEIYYAPTMREYKQLHLNLMDAEDEELGIGAAGTWNYEWHWRSEGQGFATADEARAAALAEAKTAGWWPGLVPAKGDEVPGAAIPGHLIAAAREGY